MWSIVYVWSTSKTTLNFCDWSDRVSTVMNTRYDNYVIDRIDAVYTENKTKLS